MIVHILEEKCRLSRRCWHNGFDIDLVEVVGLILDHVKYQYLKGVT